MNNVTETPRVKSSRGKLWAVFLGVVVTALGAVGYLNYQLNPLMYNGAELRAAATALVDGKNIAISDANIDWRDLRRAHIQQMKNTPDMMILGGSRWQEASREVAPGKNVYNAFVSSDHFEDMMAFTELLKQTDRMPKTLVLSVRFSTFEYLDRRHAWYWKSFTPEYQAMAQRLGVEAHPWYRTASFGKFAFLFSADAMGTKISKYSSSPVLWKATDNLVDERMDIVGSDGALRFSKYRLEQSNTEFAENDALQTAAAHKTTRLKIDQKLLSQFGTLLKYLKKEGVQVVIVQTPFHPSYYAAIQDTPYFDDVMQIERETKRVAAETGVPVAGGFNAKEQGCVRNQYRDFNHASVDCLKQLIKQIPA